MKRKIIELIAFIVLMITMFCVYITASSLEADAITNGQAVAAFAAEIIILSVSTEVVCAHFKDGEWI
jgi:uncharacterized protein YggE